MSTQLAAERKGRERKARADRRVLIGGHLVAVDAPRHGTATIYKNWYCRCPSCVAAQTADCRARDKQTKRTSHRSKPTAEGSACPNPDPAVTPGPEWDEGERHIALAAASYCIRGGLGTGGLSELLEALGLLPGTADEPGERVA